MTAERKRIYTSNAARQRAHYRRQKSLVGLVRELVEELTRACERGWSEHHLTNHLPEDPRQALAQFGKRLRDKKLIVCQADRKRPEINEDGTP